MTAVRSLLARVARLEQAKAPALTPFEIAFDSLDGYAAFVRAEIDAGAVDPVDGPLILNAVRRWHRDRVWDLWR